jgi:hypothetical protein
MNAIPGDSLFDRAARVFDGWNDPDTGARVLRIDVRGERAETEVWQTVYQQCRCFLDGGRKVLLRTGSSFWWARQGGAASRLVDLTTGEVTDPFPKGWTVVEVCDGTDTALLIRQEPEAGAALWDLRNGRMLASIGAEGWRLGAIFALADGRRALTCHFRGGRPHNEPLDTRFYLLSADQPPRVVLEATGYYCNHIQGCPSDPDLYAYDRWPAPRRDVEQVIHVASLDGSFHEVAKLDERAVRPKSMMGARDHYVWTPDGRRIVSYFDPVVMSGPTPVMGDQSSFGKDFNHFQFPWVLSVLDWKTGEDLAAPYPPGRWGCHMQVTPDGRHVVSAGGPGFDCLYAVEIEALRKGWNEHRICSYPRTVSEGKNNEPFSFPFVLPDGSGVIFNAGWPGPEHGVYLAEWPKTFG